MRKMSNFILQLDGLSLSQGFVEEGKSASLHRDESDSSSESIISLLKKTQSKVSSLENEIKRIESENIHQDRDSQKDLF